MGLTKPQIKKGLAEWDAVGPDRFFSKDGITRGSVRYSVKRGSQEYDVKALVAGALGVHSRSFHTDEAAERSQQRGNTVVKR
jgi:hypothetical protein